MAGAVRSLWNRQGLVKVVKVVFCLLPGKCMISFWSRTRFAR